MARSLGFEHEIEDIKVTVFQRFIEINDVSLFLLLDFRLRAFILKQCLKIK